ncbi:hypothetical protein ASD24_18180 [Paenibacillus sp. Root52]|uniref:hypothetical protein n=1 Tax=unclassified Paenibacillus TaxID=185978 RepID=UPI0006FAE805|nr:MULTISPECIES: hypothetical protein [unclassified Paenibacillus]KQY79876.1 hypothetical protein ASD24_18180 [Paenibacillus sp. Root52]MCG7378113.1 hypothetical protein [Paenibacillus sp. ACRSA]
MNLQKAIERINNINWGRVGSNSSEVVADLAREYLRRLALFYKGNSTTPVPPFIANIATVLGDAEEVKISDYCNVEAMGAHGTNIYVYKVFEHYVQLAKLADKNQAYTQYLSVYEPFIQIFEKEGLVILKPRELNVVGSAHIPLNSWYDKFLEMKPLDLEGLNT